MSGVRNLPSVDQLLATPEIKSLIGRFQRAYVVEECRRALDELRRELLASEENPPRKKLLQIAAKKTEEYVTKGTRGSLYPVINGSGVVLHTNLGRAVLGDRAIEMMTQVAQHYVNLEIDMDSGRRGSRYDHVEGLLCRLTGAEAALVVNNNAAAVMLALNTLASGGEAVVSRGQLVEIGGSFRIPEVMKASGTRLVEVGTTNKTYVSDFRDAITDQTRVLLSVHTSNYRIVGFTHEPSIDEMVGLGRERELPVMVDLGSGILFDFEPYGLSGELTVQDCLSAGADVVTASGDKLLGGPQAGIILGRKKYIEAMKKNQLTRALRVDKLIIAALEGTLIEYLAGDPVKNLPAVGMLAASADALKAEAESLAAALRDEFGRRGILSQLEVVSVEDKVGGGAYPIEQLPGWGVGIHVGLKEAEQVSHRLRVMSPAVLTRVRDDMIIVSVRTLLPRDKKDLVTAISSVLSPPGDKLVEGESAGA